MNRKAELLAATKAAKVETKPKPPKATVVGILADDPQYIPQYASPLAATADLRAKVSPDVHGTRCLTLTSRTMTTVDVGFSLELPAGWKAEVAARPEWARRGLVVTNAPAPLSQADRERVTILVANLGKEILVVHDGDLIAQMWASPVYRFAFQPIPPEPAQ